MKALVLCVALGLVAHAPCGSQPSLAAAPKIIGMRVHLFQDKSGSWSDDILLSKDRGAWNSIAGEHSANAALVIVEVSAPSRGNYFHVRPTYTVHLVARERGRAAPLLDRSQAVPPLNEDGKAYVPFLLYQGGCASVRIDVTIVGPRRTTPVQELLALACGE